MQYMGLFQGLAPLFADLAQHGQACRNSSVEAVCLWLFG